MPSPPTPRPADESDEGNAPPRRLWVATGWQLAARLWSAGCTLALLGSLARALDPATFGRVVFWLALYLAVESAVDMGTGAVALRRAAQDRWALPGLLAVGRRLRLRNASLAVAGFASVPWMLGEPDAGWIALAALYYLTWPLELSPTVLKRSLSYGTVSAARVLAATLRLGGVLVLLHGFHVATAGPYLVALTFSAAAANVWVHRRSLPHLPRPTIAVRAPSGMFAEAWPLGLAALCQQSYFHVDNLFVRAFGGDVEVGRYGACVRLMGFSILGAQYVAGSALPWLARRRMHGELGRAATRLVIPLTLLFAPVLGAVAAHGEEVLALVYGSDFRSSAPILLWLLAASAAVYAGAVLHTALVAGGSTRAALFVAASALVLNVGLNAWAVPRHGAVGAAATTCATELWVALASLAILARTDPSARDRRGWMLLLAPVLFWLGTRL
ncbi:Polysaccharide biosynthesis protein [Planctomycetes bacterium Pla163]|uniref:Polysaccharide biosynthesis protein n=1 Tax=Rohdeia mirabilis TaxID=2528008 RepID=A0A518D2B0_9BACT|nr:Polysaccharide biosynthesis protein [Planctomycetes bacterium Pla163]